MASQVIDIQINSTGAKTVIVDLNQISNSARTAGSSVNELKGYLGMLTGALSVEKIRQWSDAWASATGQIRVNSTSTQQAAAVTDLLFAATQRTRQSFPQMVNLYNRMATSVKDLGVSQQQLVGITENVGKILAYSHVSAGQASGALLQLSQALGSGIVRAQEFNSVLQGAPAILQVAANHIDAAGGSVTKLRQIMLAQQLTSKQLFDAIMAGSAEIEDKFVKSSAMIGQAFTVLDNAMMRVVGNLTESLGVGNKLNAMAALISDNMEQMTAGILAVGAAMVVAFTPTAIIGCTNALRALMALLLANPWTALATAVAGAATYMYEMRDSILVTSDGVTKLNDLLQVLWPDIQSGARTAMQTATSLFTSFGEAAPQAFSKLPEVVQNSLRNIVSETRTIISEMDQAWTSYFSGLDGGFEGVAEGVARVMDSVVSIATGGFAAIKTLITGFPQLIKDYLTNAFAAFGLDFQKILNVIETLLQHLINSITRMVSTVMSIGETINGYVRTVAGYMGNLLGAGSDNSLIGKTIGAYQTGSQNTHTAENYVKDLFTRAQQNQEFNGNNNDLSKSLLASVDQSLLTMHGNAVLPVQKQKKGANQANRLENQLRRLLDTIKPSIGANLELARGYDILNKAEAAGMITTKQHGDYIAALKQHYEDILDPLGKINRDMNDQINLLDYDSNTRKTYTTLLDYENQLRDKGIFLNAQEKTDLTSLIALYERRNDIADQYNTIYQQTLGKQYDASNLYAATNQAQDKGMISGDVATAYRYQSETDNAQGAVNSGNASFAQFAQSAVGTANDSFRGVANGLSDNFSTFFSSFEDGFANSIGKAITGTESFGKAMKEVATDGINSLISGLVKLGEQYLIIQASTGLFNLFGGGLFGSGSGSASSAIFSSGWAFNPTGGHADGGFTGYGNKYDPAGYVHRGEYVFDRDSTSSIGVSTLDALRRGTKSAGNSKNVSVGTPSNNVRIGDINIVNPTVTDGKMDQKTAERLTQQVNDAVMVAVNRRLTDEQRPGGILYGTGRAT